MHLNTLRISVIVGDKAREITISEEEAGNKSLLQHLQDNGIYLPALCGGHGSCGKCAVKVVSGLLKASDADESYFAPAAMSAGFRLACTAYPTEPIRIVLPDTHEEQFSVVSHFEALDRIVIKNLDRERIPIEKSPVSFARQVNPAQSGMVSLHELEKIARLAEQTQYNTGKNKVYVYRDKETILHISDKPKDLYAIGIDIGTTTLALALVNLQTGTIQGRLSLVNKQREYGADLISRIQRANDGDLPRLSQRIREQIGEAVITLCHTSAIEALDVVKMAIAGNTTMLHFLLNLRCDTLGYYPFTPITLDRVSFYYDEVFTGPLSCKVDVLPGISTYVGADITAGILCSNLYRSSEPVLLLDIGTNGEMALFIPAHGPGGAGKILAAATAAGPAFEGGNILWGTGSVPGAIASVSYQSGGFAVQTIDNQDPIGICGSGVVDTVYAGLTHKLILPNGRLRDQTTGLFLAKTADGQDILFCQKDVRELQLGKSAIRSGMDALLHQSGLRYEDIQQVFVAGGFGFKLPVASGVGIGLIPQALESKIRLIGNSALGGTIRYLLDRDTSEILPQILSISEEFSLSGDPYFNQLFIQNLQLTSD
ncbi:MAG: ASKHA domain-containing protein [Treponema sp.]|jgi:uncharacterized 2Fe-2S/4Fe-4S cluster protein (DUF4445 family)|nr:ASKHA domain-containing protein [Treponema sp.]